MVSLSLCFLFSLFFPCTHLFVVMCSFFFFLFFFFFFLFRAAVVLFLPFSDVWRGTTTFSTFFLLFSFRIIWFSERKRERHRG